MKDEDLNEFGDLAEFASAVREGLTKWFATATPEQAYNAVFKLNDD